MFQKGCIHLMVLGNCGLIETFPLKMRVVSDPNLSVRWLGETQIVIKGGNYPLRTVLF